MHGFRINFELADAADIVPWGNEQKSLDWFGLTDGLLWINAGSDTIYEYNDEARKYFGNTVRYNDYQLSRFLEDFSELFGYISEPVPEILYNSIETIDAEADRWKELHTDDIFDAFYDNEYEPFTEWYYERTLNSAHLVGGPHISCFRCGDKAKLLWESDYRLENGSSIWTSPSGCLELPYEDFVSEAERFFGEFYAAMDRQVEKSIAMDWGEVFVDKEKLAEANFRRKEMFDGRLSYLRETVGINDWDRILELYGKMKKELQSG